MQGHETTNSSWFYTSFCINNDYAGLLFVRRSLIWINRKCKRRKQESPCSTWYLKGIPLLIMSESRGPTQRAARCALALERAESQHPQANVPKKLTSANLCGIFQLSSDYVVNYVVTRCCLHLYIHH